MRFSKYLILFALSALLALNSACSSTDDAQRDFEREAFRTPSGITETDGSGNIISTDEDDWRIGPLFAGFVEVQQPAFPNPTTGQILSIELLVTGLGAVNGLDVMTLDDRNFFKRLFFDERTPLPVGFTQITINPVQFAPGGSGTISGARGLHRVFIFDGRENLITYGDIRVE
ncbi:hypothetical protein CYPRO_2261 [Cyclonatronum proteinivorum]|uniref:Uncharacterized protein n=1 Tax=Cyclonatronum proteinivorum TaxID=1457365 RepID=A0A345UM05_9BACT|nr:hypothetical protein [Cyclonatronum proteinivorum]AXJ01507.1 hypothetical protein CYPRO_2261 [Cyclonatronum proteinivorum]